MTRAARTATVGLGVLSLVGSLGIGEFVYRGVMHARHRELVATFATEPWQLAPESPLIFRLSASRLGQIPLGESRRTVPYRTNADGFRDAARGERRPGVARVLVLGDSFTFGWGVFDDEPYPQQAERHLRAAGLAVEVINAGVPGYNTEQEAALLDELMPRYRPDLVVLGFVVNDAEPQSTAPQPPAVTYRHARSWIWEDARELVARRLGGAPDWTSPNKLVSSTRYLDGFAPASWKWRESRAALGRMAAACRESGVGFLVLMLPDTTEPFDAGYPYRAVHEAVLRWSGELGVPAVDLLPAFAGRDHVEFMVPGDGHPSVRAHEAIAAVLAEQVAASLPGR